MAASGTSEFALAFAVVTEWPVGCIHLAVEWSPPHARKGGWLSNPRVCFVPAWWKQPTHHLRRPGDRRCWARRARGASAPWGGRGYARLVAGDSGWRHRRVAAPVEARALACGDAAGDERRHRAEAVRIAARHAGVWLRRAARTRTSTPTRCGELSPSPPVRACFRSGMSGERRVAS